MPTIMGVTASRLLPPRPVEVKREPRPTRIMKALKDPYAMRMKWKGSAKEFLRMRMIKRLDGCMRALHEKPPVPIQEEDNKPLQIEVRSMFSFRLSFVLLNEKRADRHTVQADISPERDQKSIDYAWSAEA